MTPPAWHAYAARVLEREQRQPTIEEVEDSNDVLILEDAAARYIGLEWRATFEKLEP